MSPVDLGLLVIAGVVSGAVNAVTGGGSLLLFPALLAVGFAPLPANVTNSVAQFPTYVGFAIGSRRELLGQHSRILWTAGVSAAGSLVGSLLLLGLPAKAFDTIVPALIAMASVTFGAQPWLTRWISKPRPDVPDRLGLLLPAVFIATIYGGYFGGALGVLLIAVLALTVHDDLRRLNALRSIMGLVISMVNVTVFTISAPVDWPTVALLLPTTLTGGFLGAKLARRLPVPVLRITVVAVGLAVSTYLFTT
jgi:uncharacterized protein